MYKRTLALYLCLLFLSAPALAAGGNATLFAREAETPYVHSICAHGNLLYIVTDRGVYTYRPGDEAPAYAADYSPGLFTFDEDGAFVPDESAPASPDWLFSQGGKLYGLSTSYARFGEAEFAEALTLKEPVALDWQAYFPESSPAFLNVLLDGDVLYLSVQADETGVRQMLAVDAQTGEATWREEAAHIDAASYQPGRLLLLTRSDYGEAPLLVTYDLASGQSQTLYAFAEWSDAPGGLAYDAASDAIYWCMAGSLYALRPGQAPEVVNYVPCDSLDIDAALCWNGQYVCKSYNGIYLRGVEAAQKPERVLRIEGFWDNTGFINRFSAQHPETPVIATWNPSGDVISAMMTATPDVDIYGLDTGGATYLALRERGYLYDLRESEVIRETIFAMPENFSRPLQKDESLLAVPRELSTFGGESWKYSPSVLERMGLTPEQLPQTWPQFFAFLAAWPQAYGDSFPDLAPFTDFERANGSVKRSVFESYFACYVGDFARSGQPLRFDTPQFRAALAAIEDLDLAQYDFTPAQCEAVNNADYNAEAEPPYNGLFESGNVFLREGMDYAWWVFEPLPLALEAGGRPLFPANMQALVVNPHSQNVDLAVQFLEAHCQNLDGALKLNLMAAFDEPLADPEAARQREAAQQRSAEIEAALITCAEADRPQYQAALENERQLLARLEQRDLIGAQSIRDYRALQVDICFDWATPFGGQDREEIRGLCQRFLDGGMSADELVAKLQQTVYMMQLEGY